MPKWPLNSNAIYPNGITSHCTSLINDAKNAIFCIHHILLSAETSQPFSRPLFFLPRILLGLFPFYLKGFPFLSKVIWQIKKQPRRKSSAKFDIVNRMDKLLNNNTRKDLFQLILNPLKITISVGYDHYPLFPIFMIAILPCRWLIHTSLIYQMTAQHLKYNFWYCNYSYCWQSQLNLSYVFIHLSYYFTFKFISQASITINSKYLIAFFI